jgi:hypothetical protein
MVCVEKSRGSVNYSSRSTDIGNAELPISKETYTDDVQGKDIQGPLKSCNNRPIPDQGSVMPFPLAPRERDKRIRGREIRTGFNKAKIIACYSRGPYSLFVI